MAPHTPGVLRFGKLKKTVAPAGYKNKQCRKQTSVLSGRTVTAYVPLRSATERKRAAFLIPCQGLRGYFANFQLFAILQQFQRVGDNSIGVAFFQFLAVAEAPEDSYGEGSGGLAGLHICGGVSHVEYFVCGETELV